ncbi:hypothetical protein ACFL7M_07550 [Thermodesulfobacteriota bacterium]
MYQKKYFGKIILVLVLSLPLSFIGCQGMRFSIESKPSKETPPTYKKEGPPPWAPAHGYRAKHKYQYYPKSRVYYEKESGVYFYYKDGKWRVSVSLPSHIRIDIKDYVTLEMDTDKPYKYDHEVIKRYPPGQLKKKNKKKVKDKWK